MLLAGADKYRAPEHAVNMYEQLAEDVEDEMSSVDSVLGWQGEDVAQFSDDDEDMGVELASDSGSMEFATDSLRETRGDDMDSVAYTCNFRRGAFSPVYEQPSPNNDPASSPVGPNTPFGDYVDRAVATHVAAPSHVVSVHTVPAVQYAYADGYRNAQCYECQHYAPVEQAAQQAPLASESVVTPTASSAYKKLAEPLADWVATFVWKVCTTGMSMPDKYAQPRYASQYSLNTADADTNSYSAFVRSYSRQPPSYLAQSTHSMLLSTLLQPSAVFLALWYIVRLPVFFGPVNLGHGDIREMRFRAELLGEPHMPIDRDTIETYAPFRLVLLGCMLANKWLDDHTFSNKTWYVIECASLTTNNIHTHMSRHTISNVPVRSLNKLESLALDLFGHDLSISTDDWSGWLKKLHTHHLSLSSPAFPQPISRPSTSPHNIIRKALDELIGVTAIAEEHRVNGTPEPVFCGLEEQKKDETGVMVSEQDLDVLEIDLDEDGPLREEYLPRRRISGASNTRSVRLQERTPNVDNSLPPPAKWSPAADEPIFRYNVRPYQYVAPQPISYGPVPSVPAPPPAPFHQALDMSRRIWPADEQVVRQSYAVPPMPVFTAPHPAAYPAYEYRYPALPAHSRSQSLSYNGLTLVQPQRGHYRSYSQTRYEGDVAYSQAHHPTLPSSAHWSVPYAQAVFPPLYDSYLYDHHSRPLVKV
jgi:hypothetical protein